MYLKHSVRTFEDETTQMHQKCVNKSCFQVKQRILYFMRMGYETQVAHLELEGYRCFVCLLENCMMNLICILTIVQVYALLYIFFFYLLSKVGVKYSAEKRYV